MVAFLAPSDCQDSNARVEEKIFLIQSPLRSLIISIETMMEQFKPRITEKHELE